MTVGTVVTCMTAFPCRIVDNILLVCIDRHETFYKDFVESQYHISIVQVSFLVNVWSLNCSSC